MTALSHTDAHGLVTTDYAVLQPRAAELRDHGFGGIVTYSPKVFVPLTKLCRDACGYCTFAEGPSKSRADFLELDEVLDLARAGKAAGCREVLFTLGDKPELRYRQVDQWLEERGFHTTVEYLASVAKAVVEKVGLLPHINAGVMSLEELKALREASFSQGLMLETVADRLGDRGQAHFGCPDKHPKVRLDMLRSAGEADIPFTTGILIGIGETRKERIDSLLAIRELNAEFGHIQEVIVQNFRAKPGTRMATSPEPSLEELLWTVSAARIVLGSEISIQVPPNLNPGSLRRLVDAGINDWGGVSPITPDHVNPEAAWPHLATLTQSTADAEKTLVPRLTIYPKFVLEADRWVDPKLRRKLNDLSDSHGYARESLWCPGTTVEPDFPTSVPASVGAIVDKSFDAFLRRGERGDALSESEVARLFDARGGEFDAICGTADALRRTVNGDDVTYVVTRNINYTNICAYRCSFCAFSKGKVADHLRGKPYILDLEEIVRRASEAWDRGATEVCLQGGIHPSYTGQTYLDICHAIRNALPDLHIHAFSPLEVWHGATTLGETPQRFLARLKDAGLASLPGTAAEILDDDIRRIICPDKLNTEQWLSVIEAAHGVGLRTTSTIMFGHVDAPINWAKHLLHLRRLQQRTGGITEFVPLPFVPMEAPMYLLGRSRRGPTIRESMLMHAVSRLVLSPYIDNIQVSWPKMGKLGAAACLSAGCNDLGGTLMNESISKAAGAGHGQEFSPQDMDRLITGIGRTPVQRTTLYGSAPENRKWAAYRAEALVEV